MASKTITTPVGIARYPHLNRPDTKFKEAGEYKVNLELPIDEAEPFIKQVEAIFAAYLPAKLAEINNKLAMEGQPKKSKLKQHRAPWEENGGLMQIKMRVPASFKGKDGEFISRQPKIFGVDGKPLEANIGGGSKIKVAVVPYTWYTASLGAGITLQPKAIQVLDLVTWGDGGSAESYGFDVSEAKPETKRTGTDDEEISW